MGLVKTRRLAAMQKQQRAKFGKMPSAKKGGALPPHLYKSGGNPAAEVPRRGSVLFAFELRDNKSMVFLL